MLTSKSTLIKAFALSLAIGLYFKYAAMPLDATAIGGTVILSYLLVIAFEALLRKKPDEKEKATKQDAKEIEP